jgi:hypothetical protein
MWRRRFRLSIDVSIFALLGGKGILQILAPFDLSKARYQCSSTTHIHQAQNMVKTLWFGDCFMVLTLCFFGRSSR